MHNKIETLTGFLMRTVTREDGSPEEIKIRQIRLYDYAAAMKVYADEVALVALACGKTKKEIEALTPESYEELQGAMTQLNAKGFFAYAARQEKKSQEMLAALPPEVVQGAFGKFLSQPPSPALPLPRA
jgi:hypothetical protein